MTCRAGSVTGPRAGPGTSPRLNGSFPWAPSCFLAPRPGLAQYSPAPPDWANYGAIISAFEAKYGIKITSLNPSGSSQAEVDAFDGTSRAPDVVDVTQAVAVKNTNLFTPYQVSTWGDIPAGGKEAT